MVCCITFLNKDKKIGLEIICFNGYLLDIKKCFCIIFKQKNMQQYFVTFLLGYPFLTYLKIFSEIMFSVESKGFFLQYNPFHAFLV